MYRICLSILHCTGMTDTLKVVFSLSVVRGEETINSAAGHGGSGGKKNRNYFSNVTQPSSSVKCG